MLNTPNSLQTSFFTYTDIYLYKHFKLTQQKKNQWNSVPMAMLHRKQNQQDKKKKKTLPKTERIVS